MCLYPVAGGARGKDCVMFDLNKLAWVQEGCSHVSSIGQLVCYFLLTSGLGGQPFVLAVIFPAAFPQQHLQLAENLEGLSHYCFAVGR